LNLNVDSNYISNRCLKCAGFNQDIMVILQPVSGRLQSCQMATLQDQIRQVKEKNGHHCDYLSHRG
jgi:hypothetical protein